MGKLTELILEEIEYTLDQFGMPDAAVLTKYYNELIGDCFILNLNKQVESNKEELAS